MQAGKMDRQITLQALTTVQNDSGEPIRSWANLATDPIVWADVQSPSQKEMFEAGQTMSVRDRAFLIRYRTDFNEVGRVVYENRNYDVYSVTEIGRGEALRLLGKAVN